MQAQRAVNKWSCALKSIFRLDAARSKELWNILEHKHLEIRVDSYSLRAGCGKAESLSGMGCQDSTRKGGGRVWGWGMVLGKSIDINARDPGRWDEILIRKSWRVLSCLHRRYWHGR